MIDIIEKRRSIRKYKETPVEDDKLMQIINCGRLAPSDSNTQPWNFIIVRSEEMRKKVALVSHNQEWMAAAPVFIVSVADIRVAIKDNVPISIDEDTPGIELKQIIIDTAIAVENMVIAAEALGLATCWITWYTQEEIRQILGIPSDKYVVSIILLGYADQEPKARPRRPIEDLIRYENW